MIDEGNSQFEYGERPAKCNECGIVRTQPSKELKEGKCIDEGQCRRFAKELVVAKAPDANNAG